MGLRSVFIALLAVAALASAGAAQRNVLLIVADDVGVDMVGAYGEHPLPATTPRIDQLAANGVLFRNAWSLPTCSPTRAALITGRMPYQTGIGRAMYPVGDTYEVALAEATLPELLGPTWDKAAVGKWHMHSDLISGITHPLQQGFDDHVGAPWNLPEPSQFSYYEYLKSVNGTLIPSTTYATTDSVDDALDLISEYQDPWFVYLAFNTPHTPWHNPPQDLHTEDVPVDPTTNPPVAVRAMIQAMDTEIGRLLDSIDPAVLSNTVVIFIGDNGTHSDATTPPFIPAHAKGSIFEGGINVPLIVAGRGVKKGFVSKGLVQATDVFTTVLDIAGVAPPPGTTGVSLTPYFQDPLQESLRPWVYSERFLPNGFGPYVQHQRAVRDQRYKLIRDVTDGVSGFVHRFYDLKDDPFETVNLVITGMTPHEQARFNMLSSVLNAIVPPWRDLGFAKVAPSGKPKLVGGSTLLPGDNLTLSLNSAPENNTAFMVIGFEVLQVPFQGGILVPNPAGSGLLLPIPTGAGSFTLQSTWPNGFPAGFQMFLQCWIPNAAGPGYWAASNALQLTTP